MRSTPWPNEILRTVTVARAPLPRSPITTPSKTCTRSRSVSLAFEPFVPLESSLIVVSLTRTCTRTVSPAESAGRPFFRSEASMLSMGFIVLFLFLYGFQGDGSGLVFDLAQEPEVLRRQPRALEEVGPAVARRAEGLAAAPAADLLMVPREQDLGRAPAPRDRGASVVGMVQDPVGEGVRARRLLVAERARQPPHRGLDHRERRHLAAGQDEVAEAQLLAGHALRDPLVDALVAAAEEHEPLEPRVALGRLLVEAAAAGREEHHRVLRRGALGQDALDRAAEGLGLHDHAGPSAERRVVHALVLVVGEVAQVVDADAREALLHRAVDDPLRERSLEHPRKDRHHVDREHQARSPAPRAAPSASSGGSSTRRPCSRSTARTKGSAKGTS